MEIQYDQDFSGSCHAQSFWSQCSCVCLFVSVHLYYYLTNNVYILYCHCRLFTKLLGAGLQRSSWLDGAHTLPSYICCFCFKFWMHILSLFICFFLFSFSVSRISMTCIIALLLSLVRIYSLTLFCTGFWYFSFWHHKQFINDEINSNVNCTWIIVNTLCCIAHYDHLKQFFLA